VRPPFGVAFIIEDAYMETSKKKWFTFSGPPRILTFDIDETLASTSLGLSYEGCKTIHGAVPHGILFHEDAKEMCVALNRVATLEQALRSLFALVEDGILVRNTSKDDDYGSFLTEANRLVVVLIEAKKALGMDANVEIEV
jgi:hypothetical protein